jgi:hypothetical protein
MEELVRVLNEKPQVWGLDVFEAWRKAKTKCVARAPCRASRELAAPLLFEGARGSRATLAHLMHLVVEELVHIAKLRHKLLRGVNAAAPLLLRDAAEKLAQTPEQVVVAARRGRRRVLQAPLSEGHAVVQGLQH